MSEGQLRRLAGSTIIDMSDGPIDALDPLLIPFTIQHDFRERFFHALQVVQGVLDEQSEDDADSRLRRIETIVREALDHGSIRLWMDSGRPLPWIDSEIGDDVEEMRTRVLEALGLEDDLKQP